MTATLRFVAETSEADDLSLLTFHDPRTRGLERIWSAHGWGARISTAFNRIRTEAARAWCPGASEDRRSPASVQWLTLTLDGITAGDYLSRVRDPEPLALGRDLRRVAARAEPLGDRIEIELVWDREPLAPRSAALAAGFPLVPEVVKLAEVSNGRTTPSTDRHRGRVSR